MHRRRLTTRALDGLAGAREIVAPYRRRRAIEPVFRVVKTQGFDIEAVPLREDGPPKDLARATLIAAIRVQRMPHDRDGLAGRPATDVFKPDDLPPIEAIGSTREDGTARQSNPHPPGWLARATWICARLGGSTGYYRKPGPIVLVKGHARLTDMPEGIKRCGLVRTR